MHIAFPGFGPAEIDDEFAGLTKGEIEGGEPGAFCVEEGFKVFECRKTEAGLDDQGGFL